LTFKSKSKTNRKSPLPRISQLSLSLALPSLFHTSRRPQVFGFVIAFASRNCADLNVFNVPFLKYYFPKCSWNITIVAWLLQRWAERKKQPCLNNNSHRLLLLPQLIWTVHVCASLIVLVCEGALAFVVVVFSLLSSSAQKNRMKEIFREFWVCFSFFLPKREKRKKKQQTRQNNKKKSRETQHTCKATKEKANKRERESANCVSDAKKFKNINNAHQCFIFVSPNGL